MIGIQVIADDRGVQRMLLGVDTAASEAGLVAFLQGIVNPYLSRRAAQRFSQEGDDVTGAWQQLADSTVSIREGQGFPGPHPINKRTGQLENYIVNDKGDTDVNTEWVQLTRPSGTSDPVLQSKFKVAQQGGSQVGRRSTPPRPVLGLNEADLTFIVAKLSFYLQTAAATK